MAKNKGELWLWIEECFNENDCEGCPFKKECDTVWEIVKVQ